MIPAPMTNFITGMPWGRLAMILRVRGHAPDGCAP